MPLFLRPRFVRRLHHFWAGMSPGARASVRRWTTLPAQLAVRARLFILHGTHEHCGKPCYAELAAACSVPKAYTASPPLCTTRVGCSC